MAVTFLNDPNHWDRRAKEARAVAQQISHEHIKERMLRIAKGYQKLAERALERSSGTPQPKAS